jgi:hypothetical protein
MGAPWASSTAVSCWLHAWLGVAGVGAADLAVRAFVVLNALRTAPIHLGWQGTATSCKEIIFYFQLSHTHHSRFILKGVAEASQILLWDADSSETPRFYQNYLVMSNTADVTKPIAVWSQAISGVHSINHFSINLFKTSTEEREKCYSFILSRTPHESSISHC